MNDATLQAFRQIADRMAGPEPRDWEWIGQHLSQRMFGITQQRAEDFARRHGGLAKQQARRDGDRAHALEIRRRIVTTAVEAFIAGKIDAADYNSRIDRANATSADAPYYCLRTG